MAPWTGIDKQDVKYELWRLGLGVGVFVGTGLGETAPARGVPPRPRPTPRRVGVPREDVGEGDIIVLYGSKHTQQIFTRLSESV